MSPELRLEKRLEKQARKQSRAGARKEQRRPPKHFPLPVREPLQAKTEAQGHYLLSIQSNPLTFGIGPAGTGKTHVAVSLAADALIEGRIERLVLTRPAKPADGEELGFLPGDLAEKFSPYLGPVLDILNERLGESQVERLIRENKIIGTPLGFMRGKTFKHSFVILDEAQNASPKLMEMFLTRLGKYCTAVVNGDPRQSDIAGINGLVDAELRLKDRRIPGIQFCYFNQEDNVRSGLSRAIAEVYEA